MNDDIVSHVYSFLPIRTDYLKNATLHTSMKKYIHLRKWLTFYSTKFSTGPKDFDYYINWLHNDILRWCNNDIAMMYGLVEKYIDIEERLKTRNYMLGLCSSTGGKLLIKEIFDALSENEVNDLNIFLEGINEID